MTSLRNTVRVALALMFMLGFSGRGSSGGTPCSGSGCTTPSATPEILYGAPSTELLITLRSAGRLIGPRSGQRTEELLTLRSRCGRNRRVYGGQRDRRPHSNSRIAFCFGR